MTIMGIGTDIVDIDRIKKIVCNSGERFALRVLRVKELVLYKKHQHPIRFLAKRFAAKEAAAKALGTGISSGLSFFQFEVYNNQLGKPLLKLYSQASEIANNLGINNIHLTLTDDGNYACAIVIYEQKNN